MTYPSATTAPGCGFTFASGTRSGGWRPERAALGGRVAAAVAHPEQEDVESSPRTGIRKLVALLRQDSIMSRKEAERRLGHAVASWEWTDAHVAYYRGIGRRDLAWTARP